MKLILLLFFLTERILFSDCLIEVDWPTLHREVTLRYFSPDKYHDSQNPSEIWNDMGANITCTVSDDLSVSLILPDNFNQDLPFKVFTHGFSSRVYEDDKTTFVEAWMNQYEKKVNVILVDWRNLASWTGFDDWDNYVYDLAARNCIDVGEFVGMCLSGLSNRLSIPGANFHFAGHSLGSHVMGKAGRTFAANQQNSELVGRISGLDPAGPRFVDGPYVDAIPELAENILSKESAAFVDVIHSNGGFEPCVVCTTFRSGTILQLGHMDFYPDGGSVQSGCLFGIDARPGGLCSHTRAVQYFVNSIREPFLFPAVNCASVEECNQEIATTDQISGYMGEGAMSYWDGQSRSLFYHDLEYCHWTYYDYSNWMCLKNEEEA